MPGATVDEVEAAVARSARAAMQTRNLLHAHIDEALALAAAIQRHREAADARAERAEGLATQALGGTGTYARRPRGAYAEGAPNARPSSRPVRLFTRTNAELGRRASLDETTLAAALARLEEPSDGAKESRAVAGGAGAPLPSTREAFRGSHWGAPARKRAAARPAPLAEQAPNAVAPAAADVVEEGDAGANAACCVVPSTPSSNTTLTCQQQCPSSGAASGCGALRPPLGDWEAFAGGETASIGGGATGTSLGEAASEAQSEVVSSPPPAKAWWHLRGVRHAAGAVGGVLRDELRPSRLLMLAAQIYVLGRRRMHYEVRAASAKPSATTTAAKESKKAVIPQPLSINEDKASAAQALAEMTTTANDAQVAGAGTSIARPAASPPPKAPPAMTTSSSAFASADAVVRRWRERWMR